MRLMLRTQQTRGKLQTALTNIPVVREALGEEAATLGVLRGVGVHVVAAAVRGAVAFLTVHH